MERTGGAIGAAWAVVALVNAWPYVWFVPRLMRALDRREVRTVMTGAPSSFAEMVAAGLTAVPGIAVIVGARSSTLWHVIYLILGLTGWWLMQPPPRRSGRST